MNLVNATRQSWLKFSPICVVSLLHIYSIYYIEPPNKRVKLNDGKLNEFWRALKNASCKKFLRLFENTRFLEKNMDLPLCSSVNVIEIC